MILLTRLSGTVFALNAELIERIDSTPDTVITLLGGTKYVVAEPLLEVIATVREHRAEVLALSDAWTLAPDQPRGSAGARRRGSLAVVSAYPDGAPADQHASAAPSTGATP